MSRLDLHQHLWTEPLLAALAARAAWPYVRRVEGRWVLHAAGEPGCVLAPERVETRIAALEADRLDRAVIALSSPIGIEGLAPEVAWSLIDTHLDAVLELGPRFAAWGPIPLRGADAAAVDAVLDRGCVGVSLPATALAGRAALDSIAPALERVQARDAILFVHPGVPAAEPALDDPLWWPALTDYVAQMQAAWLTFAAAGRRELPHLRVVFAMLAGGAPAFAERLAARGGPAVDLADAGIFYDTSSYGPRMVEAMARWVGPSRLVYGSDRPVIEPVPTGREEELMHSAAQLIDAPVAAR
jgi:6-methylsalicylate decarboxylase